ncbi:MAG: penicillin-binding protein 1C [Cyclobacteriaceae bacterium]|nr:penicillin-binding protein 1C [Cyclobacteriaceae bacterium]
MEFLKRYRYFLIFGFLLISYYFCLPPKLFHDSYSTVLEDRDGKLLGATIADDGQWRFPEGNPIPEKFKAAIILFEDKRFNQHRGVDLRSLARATQQNWNAGKIVSGGSTITMQVIRLTRSNKSRTFFEKFIEIVLATRLELRSSKDEILSLYAAHAPFGGNVVGIESACWRYFGRDAAELSWSEAALLAVLPNNPSLIHPGKNRAKLKQKRDRLLQRMMEAGNFDQLTLELSVSEDIPENPIALPRTASHLLMLAIKDGLVQTRIRSSLLTSMQERTNQIIADHHQSLKGNQVFNAAALVMEVKTGRVLAYTGNAQAGRDHDDQVDIIQSKRSTGSILKPFLFAAMLDEGKILPRTLQPDIPTLISGFSPRNFSKQFDGAVAADQALIRSLNIPAVHELRDYRYEKFYELLKGVGISTLTQAPDHYGLSLILGGAEGTLWDITGVYASMARTLQSYFDAPGKNRYDKSDFHPPFYLMTDSVARNNPEESSWLSAGSLYLTMNVLKELYRPGEETGWQHFNSTKKIAWKTGTSHGLRDGWAVGVNGDYAVGVWVGNADGEGRPGLTGTESAAPILFDIFSQLPGNTWFQEPAQELVEIQICTRSGMRANEWCMEIEAMKVTKAGLQSTPCRYHQPVHLSLDGMYRVHSDCESINTMKTVSWFVLPPVQEYYYKTKNLSYRILPPLRSDCANPASVATMDLVYPRPQARIFIPIELDGQTGSTLFEATHRQSHATIYWHLDGAYIGSTTGSHRMAIAPVPGMHMITLIDEAGTILEQGFTVFARK